MAIQSSNIEKVYIGSTSAKAMYKGSVKIWEESQGLPYIQLANGVNELNLEGTNSAYIPLVKDDSANSTIRLEFDIWLDEDLFTDFNADYNLCVCGALENSWWNGCIIGINTADADNYKLQSWWRTDSDLTTIEHLAPGRQTLSITPTGIKSYIAGTIYLFSLYNYRNNCPTDWPYQCYVTYPSAEYYARSELYPLKPLYRIFSLKIYGDNDTLLHEYKPAIVNGHKGMYDEVTQTFGACNNDDYFTIGYN